MTETERCDVALAYLARRHVMTVATVADTGPAAAAVYYASVGLDLVFLSSPTTRHSLNLANRPQVAITIQDQETEWRWIRGLQLLGTGEQLDGAEARGARDALMAKVPDIFGKAAMSVEIARALAGVRWYRVRIAHMRFIDNSYGLGHADEWSRAELLTCLTAIDQAP